MLLARVVGTVVASRKEPSMEGHKFLLLRQITPDGKPTSTFVVASDAVGAGEGEVVLYASGSSARQTEMTNERPCDAVVMAIVDSVEMDDAPVYDKSAPAKRKGA